MLLQPSHPVFRVLSVLVLLTFLPTSVEAWNFVPQQPIGGTLDPSELASRGSARTGNVKLLSNTELEESRSLKVAAVADVVAPVLQASFSAAANTPSRAKLNSIKASSGNGRVLDTVRDSLALLEQYPESAEAGPVNELLIQVFSSCPSSDLADLAKALPDASSYTQLSAQMALGALYNLVANRLKSSPAGGVSAESQLYFGKTSDLAWDVLQTHGADIRLREVAKAYLGVNRRLGRGEEARDALAQLARSVSGTYVAWAIQAELDGVEPDVSAIAQASEQLAAVEDQYERAVAVYKKKGSPAADEMLRRAAASAAVMFVQYPDAPELFFAGDFWHSATKLLGREAASEAREQMQIVADSYDKPCMAKAAANLWYAISLSVVEGIYREAGRYIGNAVDELDSQAVAAALTNPAVAERTKGKLEYTLGYLAYAQGHSDKAAEQWKRVRDTYAHVGDIAAKAAYGHAFECYRTSPDKPEIALTAYHRLVTDFPENELAPEALFNMAHIYANNGDSVHAAEYFEKVISEYPASEFSEPAATKAEASRLELAKSEAGSQRQAAIAQICGPHALRAFLATRGVDVELDVLAQSADTTEVGTSMAGLISAARVCDVDLVGVQVDVLDDLRPPFIAHVDGNHFVAVLDADDASVTVSDNGEPRVLPRSVFLVRWEGKALIERNDSLLARVLTPAENSETVGGCGGGDDKPSGADYGCIINVEKSPDEYALEGGMIACDPALTYLPGPAGGPIRFAETLGADFAARVGGVGDALPPQQLTSRRPCNNPGTSPCFVPPCPVRCDDGSVLWEGLTIGSYGTRSNEGPGRSASGPEAGGAGGYGRGPAASAVASLGSTSGVGVNIRRDNPAPELGQWCNAGVPTNSNDVRAEIQAFQLAQVFRETDISVPLAGHLPPLSFYRTFHNPWGRREPDHYTVALRWQNNIGDSWAHSQNAFLQTSTGEPHPGYIYLRDANGSHFLYELYEVDVSGNDMYKPHPSHMYLEKDIRIYRNPTSKDIWLTMASGLRYDFTPTTEDSYQYARLESITDSRGNTITYGYDGAVGSGRLTKVAAPASDGRSLRLSYTPSSTWNYNVITKVELLQDTTVKYYVNYDYQDATYVGDGITRHTALLTKIRKNGATEGVTYTYAFEPNYVDGGITRKANFAIYATQVEDREGIATQYDPTYIHFNYPPGSGNYIPQITKVKITDEKGLEATWDMPLGSAQRTTTIINNRSNNRVTLKSDAAGWLVIDAIVEDATNSADAVRWMYDYGYVTSTKERNISKVYWTKDLSASPARKEYGHYRMNASGRITSMTDMYGTVNQYTYTGDGNTLLTKQVSGSGSTYNWIYGYNSTNELTKMVAPGNAAAGWQIAYDSAGNMTRYTTPANEQWNYAYDGKGHVTQVTSPQGRVTSYQYDCFGHVTRVTDPLSRVTQYEYAYTACAGCGGTPGKITKVILPTSEYYTYNYTPGGRISQISGPDGTSVAYGYDQKGILTRVTSPAASGDSVTYEYDGVHNLTRMTDAQGNYVTYEYLVGTRQLTKTGGSYGDIYYRYDNYGVLTRVVDESGDDSTYGYDSLYRLTAAARESGDQVRLAYDALARITRVAGGASGTFAPTTYAFDTSAAVLSLMTYTNSGGQARTVTYNYDASARLTKQTTSWLGSDNGLRYAFDLDGLVTRITDHDDSTMSFTYDSGGQVTTLSDWHGSSFGYTYTALGLLSTQTAPGNRTWDYDYAGARLTKYAHPNGVTTNYAFDDKGIITKIEHKDGANVVQSFTYTFDDAYRVITKKLADNGYWVYSRASASHMTDARRKDSSHTQLAGESIGYTNAHSINSHTPDDGVMQIHGIDSGNRLYYIAYADARPSSFFYFDALGRMISKAQGAYSATYEYEMGGQLSAVTTDFPGETSAVYTYDAKGQRRSVTAGGTTTKFRWLGDRPINEENSGGTLAVTYVHGLPGIWGSTKADIAGSTPASGTVRYYLQELNGSTAALLGADKSTLGTYDYFPYGTIRDHAGESARMLYTGQFWDDDAGLYYFSARSYDPVIARWLTPEPTGQDGPNLYHYAYGDPVSHVDLGGEFAESVALGGAQIGGGPLALGNVVRTGAAAGAVNLWVTLTRGLGNRPHVEKGGFKILKRPEKDANTAPQNTVWDGNGRKGAADPDGSRSNKGGVPAPGRLKEECDTKGW